MFFLGVVLIQFLFNKWKFRREKKLIKHRIWKRREYHGRQPWEWSKFAYESVVWDLHLLYGKQHGFEFSNVWKQTIEMFEEKKKHEAASLRLSRAEIDSKSEEFKKCVTIDANWKCFSACSNSANNKQGYRSISEWTSSSNAAQRNIPTNHNWCNYKFATEIKLIFSLVFCVCVRKKKNETISMVGAWKMANDRKTTTQQKQNLCKKKDFSLISWYYYIDLSLVGIFIDFVRNFLCS